MDFVTLLFLIVGGGLAFGFFLLMVKASRKKAIDKGISGLPNFSATYKFMAEDGKSGIAIDEQNRKACLTTYAYGNLNHKIIDYRDILEAEILEDGHTVTKTSRTSQAASALIGGVLFGGVGAVVGALTGSSSTKSKIKRVDLKIIVNDTKVPVFMLNFMDLECAQGGLFHKEAMQKAQEWIGRLKVLMRLADDEDHVTERRKTELTASATSRLESWPRHKTPKRMAEVRHQQETIRGPSDAGRTLDQVDKLAKLVKLRDEGVLSDDEFQKAKQHWLDEVAPRPELRRRHPPAST
jgi:hypothetical protein